MLAAPAYQSSQLFVRALPKYRSSTTKLPENFQPTPYTVIMGRGKDAANAIGNRRLKILVETQLAKYLKAKSRREKSFVVAHVLETVQDACPVGAFVKLEKGSFYEVSDACAREKIGSLFRDQLHNHYKSSTKSKMAKRRALKAQKQTPTPPVSDGDTATETPSRTSGPVQAFEFAQTLFTTIPSDEESFSSSDFW